MAGKLAERFTVHLVDRRGRGLSGDGSDGGYDIAREVEDLAAVAEAAGEPVALLAHSFGAVVALTALAGGERFSRVLLYEPPFRTPGSVVFPPGVLDRMADELADGDRDAALSTFFREALGLDEAAIAVMRPTEIWRARLAATHTIVREGRAVERFVLSHRLAQLTVPVRFLLGTKSPAYLRASTEAAHAAIPGSDVVDLAGQAHMAMDTVPAEFAHLVIQFCHPGP